MGRVRSLIKEPRFLQGTQREEGLLNPQQKHRFMMQWEIQGRKTKQKNQTKSTSQQVYPPNPSPKAVQQTPIPQTPNPIPKAIQQIPIPHALNPAEPPAN
ncbi:putative ras-related protein Rab-34, isoform NARR [Sesbania bispinosa]|nr:putative ras-related protein Rab-34, isoform NARR [Sesbania bispinosa]